MRKLLPLLCACLTLALVGAGCGDDEESSDGGGGGGGGATTAESAEGGASAEVTMKDIEFEPASVSVAKGGEVTWTNEDSAGHDVTADDKSFKSGSPGGMAKGDTFTRKFTKAGSFKYVCSIHPGMEGTITVK